MRKDRKPCKKKRGRKDGKENVWHWGDAELADEEEPFTIGEIEMSPKGVFSPLYSVLGD